MVKNYLTNYALATNKFNQITTQGEDRVERFGVTIDAINAILNCSENTGLSVLFGLNIDNKMTTILIGAKNNGAFNLNNNPLIPCGRASYITQPCPNDCDPGFGG